MNLDDNPRMREQFELGYDIPRIVSTIRFETGQVVSENTTLIVLDEIQACPKALTSLKYFCENAPGYAVAAAGFAAGIVFAIFYDRRLRARGGLTFNIVRVF